MLHWFIEQEGKKEHSFEMGATEKGDGDTVRTRIIAPAEGLPGLPPPSDSSSGSSSGSLSDSELSDRYVFCGQAGHQTHGK